MHNSSSGDQGDASNTLVVKAAPNRHTFYLYGSGDSTSEDRSGWLVTPKIFTTNAPPRSNSLSYEYSALHEAIDSMLHLPNSEPLHISGAAAAAAKYVLGQLAVSRVRPPKVLSNDHDEVVFTWNYPEFKRYLSVFEDDAGLLDLGKQQPMRCAHDLPNPTDAVWGEWARVLGGALTSSGSNSADAD